MKEINMQRAKKIVDILESKRYKLEILNMHMHQGFLVRVNARNNISESHRSIALSEEDIPKYLEEMVISTVIRELERQIKALEAELETL